MVHPEPFFDLTFGDSYLDDATKGRRTCGMQFYHSANFQVDLPHHCQDICTHTHKNRVTADENHEISDKTHISVVFAG